jgi:dTDP-4-dehydrorhamnose 3,5-epimerase
MALELIGEFLNGLRLFKPSVYFDERGYFIEAFKQSDLNKFGIKENFYQDNHSKSSKGVLRGMHFQWNLPQGKLIRVVSGSIQITEIDIRKNSKTLGSYWTGELTEQNANILWVPPGFANGFLALEDNTHLIYKCTNEYNMSGESSILWNDTDININWRINNPVLSNKDKNAQTLKEWLQKEESNFFKL